MHPIVVNEPSPATGRAFLLISRRLPVGATVVSCPLVADEDGDLEANYSVSHVLAQKGAGPRMKQRGKTNRHKDATQTDIWAQPLAYPCALPKNAHQAAHGFVC